MTTTSSLASTALAVPPPVARPVCTSVLLTSCLLGRVSLDLRAVRDVVAPGGSLVGGAPPAPPPGGVGAPGVPRVGGPPRARRGRRDGAGVRGLPCALGARAVLRAGARAMAGGAPGGAAPPPPRTL